MSKCATCQDNLPKMNFWEHIKSIAEYLINFPNDPQMKLPMEIVCEDCYERYMVYHNNLTPAERIELDKKAKEDFENETKRA